MLFILRLESIPTQEDEFKRHEWPHMRRVLSIFSLHTISNHHILYKHEAGFEHNHWKSEADISTFRRPSPDNCARSLPLGPTTANVGHEFTPSSLHKYISPSLTTYIYAKALEKLNGTGISECLK